MIDQPDTILYATVDSLRKDAVTAEQMPYVHGLAHDGLWFDQMISCAPATAASFTALMASRYFSDVDGVGLPDRQFTTLAEGLPADYRTIGRSTNQFTSSYYNYDRGFDWFDSPADGLKFTIRRHLDEEDTLFKLLERGYHLALRATSDGGGSRGNFNTPADTVNSEVLNARDPSAAREFIWCHYMDPHHPYEPPTAYLPASVDSRAEGQRLSQELPGRVPAERSADVERCRELYHAECQYFDDTFADFHDQLPKDTLIVLVGDHGELLGEHDRLGHPHEMWQELINVPCLIYHPDLPSTTIETQQTTLDLAPTLLRLIGADVPSSMRGRPIDVPDPDGRSRVYGTIETPDNVGFARTAAYKWVRHNSHRSTQTDQGELLFPVADGTETVELGREEASREPEIAADLRAEFEDTVAAPPLATGRQFEDEQVKQHMADLGYLQQQ